MIEPRDVVILEGARTPFCRAGSLLSDVPAQELGRIAVREAIERAEVTPEEIDEVIVGNIAGPHDATNVARVIALAAGVPPQRIIFSGIGKTPAELEAALTAKIYQINIESVPELRRLSELAAARGRVAGHRPVTPRPPP